MKTIYKYLVAPTNFGVSPILLPKDAIIRKVASRGDAIFLWAEVETNNKKEHRNFEVFSTGQEIPTDREDAGCVNRIYIDTVFIGLMDFHVYEKVK